MRPARGVAVKDGHLWPPEGLVLDGREHAGRGNWLWSADLALVGRLGFGRQTWLWSADLALVGRLGFGRQTWLCSAQRLNRQNWLVPGASRCERAPMATEASLRSFET